MIGIVQQKTGIPLTLPLLPTISAVLGNSGPDSTSTYLATDTEHMRACVLSLPRMMHQLAGR